MSILKVNSIQSTAGVDLLGPIQAGRAKAWALLQGSGTASRTGFYNVSGITDNGTGHYTLTFATALTNANYSAVASGCLLNSGSTEIVSMSLFDFTTTTIKLKTFRLQSSAAVLRDFEQISVAIFGDP